MTQILLIALIVTILVVDRSNVICFWNMFFVVIAWLAALTEYEVFNLDPPKPKKVANHCLVQSIYHIYNTILTADIIQIMSIMIRCMDGNWLDVFKNTFDPVNKYWSYYGTTESKSSIWPTAPQVAYWKTYVRFMDADGVTEMWEIQTNDSHSNTKIKLLRLWVVVCKNERN